MTGQPLAALLATCCLLAGGSGTLAPLDFIEKPNQCGAWALYQACPADGRDCGAAEVARLLPGNGEPRSVLQLQEALTELGVPNVAYRYNDETAVVPGRTYILRVHDTQAGMDSGHFVAALGHSPDSFAVMEPLHGVSILTRQNTEKATIDALIELDPQSAVQDNVWWLGLAALGALAGAAALFGRVFRPAAATVLALGLLGCSGGNADGVQASSEPDGIVVEPATGIVLAPLSIPADDERRNLPLTGRGTFALHNRASRPVRLTDCTTSCPCGTAVLSADTISPGGRVTCEVRVAGYTASPTPLDVFVATDLPEQRNLVVNTIFPASAAPPVLLNRPPIQLGTVVCGERRAIQVRVTEAATEQRWLHGADGLDSGSPVVSFAAGDVESSGGDLEVRMYDLVVKVPDRRGRFERTLRLFGQDGGAVAEIVVSGDAVPPVRVVPETVRLVAGNDSEVLERFVTVQIQATESDIAHEVVGDIPEWLAVAATDEGDVFRLEVSPAVAFGESPGGPVRVETTVTLAPRSGQNGDGPTLPVAVTLLRRAGD